MANTPRFADATIKAMVDVAAALYNTGTIQVYTGTQPTDGNTALGAQTLLGTLTFGSTAFGASSASGSAGSRVVTATANSISSDTSADNTGTAAWFRALKSDGTTIIGDGSIGTSGADLNLVTTSLVAGETIAVTSFTLTMPEQ